MKASIIYRISSVLLLLFTAGHTLGFRKGDPKWGIDALVAMMKSVHFDAQGSSRCYWDFYVGFGLFVSVFLLFSAVLCWQLGSLTPAVLSSLGGICWTLVACFAGVTFLSWRYFFLAPIAFSVLITICLVAAAVAACKSN